ncbi:MAG: hypothetical protein NXI24_06380 [bacterium]|nr:hypothetical protein [bacterium]
MSSGPDPSFIRSRPGFARILFWSAVCGAVSTLAMAPFQWPLASYLSLWPLFYLSHSLRNSLTGLLAAGLLSSFFCSWFAFHWFVLTIQNFGDPGLFVAALVFFPLAFIFQFKFVVFCVGFGLSRRYSDGGRALPGWLCAGTIGAAADLFTPNLFPWHWGNLLAANSYFAQLAEWIGPAGLSFVLFALSHEAFSAASAFQRGLFRWRRYWLAAAAATLLLSLGALRHYQWRSFQADAPTVRVAMVQPNAPLEKTTDEGRRDPNVEAAASALLRDTIPALIATAHEVAGQTADRPIDLIALPESAVPYYTTDDHYLNRRYRVYNQDYRALAQSITTPASRPAPALLLNETNFRVHESQDAGRIRARAYNSAALYLGGARAGEYHKERLLPFGEYAPGLHLWHSLGVAQLLPAFLQNSRFHPGDPKTNRPLRIPFAGDAGENSDRISGRDSGDSPGASAAHARNSADSKSAVLILPTICYEIIFSDYVREFLGRRDSSAAGLLVNLTQDGWYGDTIETHQHFELARLRSIETRRALLRANNTGASGFVDLTGSLAAPINANSAPRSSTERGVLLWDAPVQSEYTTLYMRIGHWWLLIPIFVLVLRPGLDFLRNRRRPA